MTNDSVSWPESQTLTFCHPTVFSFYMAGLLLSQSNGDWSLWDMPVESILEGSFRGLFPPVKLPCGTLIVGHDPESYLVIEDGHETTAHKCLYLSLAVKCPVCFPP